MSPDISALPPGVDPNQPSIGRMYDYLLGGDQYFDADKAAMERILQLVPEARDIAHANRVFLERAVRRMAGDYGIKQFIDVGAGLPTRWNSHQSAQAIDPSCRVVYSDNEPIVVEHAKHLLEEQGADNVAYIPGDIREPEAILNHPETQALIDFDQPIGLVHIAVYHFIPNNPWELCKRYLDAVPSGSYLAVSHFTDDGQDPAKVQHFRDVTSKANEQTQFLPRADVERFFDGLELVPPYEGAEPGVVYAGEWGSKDPSQADVSGQWLYCGIARKP